MKDGSVKIDLQKRKGGHFPLGIKGVCDVCDAGDVCDVRDAGRWRVGVDWRRGSCPVTITLTGNYPTVEGVPTLDGIQGLPPRWPPGYSRQGRGWQGEGGAYLEVTLPH